MYVSYHQDGWNTWLPLPGYAYNNSDYYSTKQSPFFTVYGRDPHFNSAHITQKVSNHAYHLKPPPQWKSSHPVSHISLSEPVKTSTIPNWNQEPPLPISIEEEEWEFSQILDSKLKRGKLCYLLEWKGFSQDPERSTWEPDKKLKNCAEPVKDFHSFYPCKSGPNSLRP
ncbi:hypothetical protein O181_003195 [Austropuccinia psidii MF-1]|uniref:Chromo domain-containing protein n=1 Tax=Austropuccinia psidii MF-1 TaxID=1389203 RepID=A0A9Q3GDM8_9BASI|nr:hypothetical protein [Austropuccinia psidii MF-1]